MQIDGANPNARPRGTTPLPGIVNYFIGDEPDNWHGNIPTFGGVRYEGVYTGIDLAYYGNNGQLEYDFIVSPGADPNAISLNFAGPTAISCAEPLRTFHLTKCSAATVSNQGCADPDRRRRAETDPPLRRRHPFLIDSVVVGNVQYPAEVADAVSRKLAATQDLQRKDTEIEIERKERTKREVQAQGIANAMQIIRGQLSAMYIQHEAIEAQKLMVSSPNHTVVYIPVGADGRADHGHVSRHRPSRASSTPRSNGSRLQC